MDIISGTADSLQEIYREQAAYRKKVFIENLGWDLHTMDGHRSF